MSKTKTKSVYSALYQNKKTKRKPHQYRPEDEYETPFYIYAWLNAIWHFTIDAAASARVHKCRHYWSRVNSAFDHIWTGHIVFLNPPFRGVKRWIIKARTEADNGATVVMLVPAFICDAWFYKYCASAQIIIVEGRIKFLGPRNPTGYQAWFGCIVVIFQQGDQPNPDGSLRISFSNIVSEHEKAEKAARRTLTPRLIP